MFARICCSAGDLISAYIYRQTGGAIALAFALMLPVLIGSAGLALDLGQSYLVKQRLASALDAAALAATASETTEDGITDRVTAYLKANYPANKVGALDVQSIDVSINGDDVTVFARADYDTSFLRLLGRDQITISESTTIHRAIKGLEVVMVLDNTGSMQTVNMDALKIASTNFINILFDRVDTPEDIKIGIVPYSSSVRIGFYGLGLVPDDAGYDANGMDGAYEQYGDGTPFVTLPPDVHYVTYSAREEASGWWGDRSADDGWYGCVVEHHSNYNEDATYVTGSYGQLWSTDPDGLCTSGANCSGHGWNPSSNSNDPYSYDVNDNYTGPWDIYAYGNVGKKCLDYDWHHHCDEYADDYTFDVGSNPNASCPWAYIQPLTSDQDKLLSIINSMKSEGSTYSNIGMAWGMRLLSPEAPFTEGVAWGDQNWNKAIVMMTDGEMSPGHSYSTYWDESKTAVDDIGTLNDRLTETCNLLKSHGVTIYTITFAHATSDISDATRAIYRDCATDPEHYYDAPSEDQLNTVFSEISAALARLHISN